MNRSKDSLAPFVVGLLLGLLQGTLFGILFAPKAGSQINKEVNRFIATLPEQLQQDPPGKLAFLKRTRLQLETRVDNIRRTWNAGRQVEAKRREEAATGGL